MLITDRYSNYVFDIYLISRDTDALISAFKELLGKLANQYQLFPEAIECDNEIRDNHRLVAFFNQERHIRLEPSAPYTQEQNGGAERSGGVIKAMAAAMRAAAKLPHFLWTEIVRAAIYLNNRTPKYLIFWQSPYESFYSYLAFRDGIVVKDRKPDQTHLRAYGCKAYAMYTEAMAKKNRLLKLKPKAWIGYLVGYNSTNIYRIWNPLTKKVLAVRDVIFNEREFFSGDIKDLKDDLLTVTEDELTELLQDHTVAEPDSFPLSMSTQEEDEELRSFGLPEHPARDGVVLRGMKGGETAQVVPEPAVCEPDQLYTTARFQPMLTPAPTPPPVAAMATATIRELTEHKESAMLAGGRWETNELSPYALAGPDCRAIRNRACNWEAAFNAGRLAARVVAISGSKRALSKVQLHKLVGETAGGPGGKEFKRKARALSKVQLHETVGQTAGGPDVPASKPFKLSGKTHRRQMPPLPKTHKELQTHPLGSMFLEAEKKHLQSHAEMRSWSEADKETARGHQLLDCMWVYVYKFDKNGYFTKCKARLVVRGDQQAKSIYENTYASTLAGRSFRTLMAIAARFDLELIQYDAVNAFVNARLPYNIYMRMPPGYRLRGKILHLQKALYGLRESPLLWQKDFTSTLGKLGFTPVPHEPCCFVKEGVIIFFYVDDIVVAYRKANQPKVDFLIEQLKSIYQLTGGDELQWFLGIEIVRDRIQRLIWLSQAAFIDKLANLITNTSGPYPTTPMKQKELFPFDGRASRQSTNLFQRRTGSILYAAVITRADVAFPISRLTRFNTNPSPEHLDAVEHLIRYLLGTKFYAMQLGGSDTFDTWSDSSFADNTLDRKSSQAYVMRLFGGTIGWRANKQDTVTTSTTEAELLSLAQAAKEAMFVSRLIKEIGIELDSSRINIWCDNKQTIRLVNAEVTLLRTKLRHVDIHNHWLRQEAERRRIKVSHVSTDDMLADGLTKTLPADRFIKFRDQIGLVDIKQRIECRKLKELTMEDLDKMEDMLPGGESEWQTA
jgi:hypothetical protein